MFQVLASQSTSIGVRLFFIIALQQETIVNAGRIISSLGFNPNA
jgi:hypothetical protein